MKKFNWLIFCVLITFFVGVGCSGMAPNQIAPAQTADSGGDQYCFEEDVEMDLCE